MINKSTLLKELQELKENWLKMGKNYSDHKENYSADAYKDCSNDIEQFMDKITKTFAIDEVDDDFIMFDIEVTPAISSELDSQQKTPIQIKFECNIENPNDCDFQYIDPAGKFGTCKHNSLYGCEHRMTQKAALINEFRRFEK